MQGKYKFWKLLFFRIGINSMELRKNGYAYMDLRKKYGLGVFGKAQLSWGLCCSVCQQASLLFGFGSSWNEC